MKISISTRNSILFAVVGVVGGLITFGVILEKSNSTILLESILGGIYGIIFSRIGSQDKISPGAGLLKGLGYSLIAWLLVPVGLLSISNGMGNMGSLVTARDHFPELAAYVLGFGLPLGLASCVIEIMQRTSVLHTINPRRAIIVGGVAGLVGGWVFGRWMAQTHFFVVIAQIVNSDSESVGMLLHYLIAMTIGISFGFLFQLDVRGIGSSIGWGMGYGMLWWFLGALTLFPLLLGNRPEWTYQAGNSTFEALVGHIMFGILLGIVYALLDRAWVGFFHRSDPIYQELEGPGTRTLRSLGYGALASITGGFIFSIIMISSGVLPRVAEMVGGSSAVLGYGVHIVISTLIGMTYGVLFRQANPDFGAAMISGLIYGLAWWFLGPLTLMPVLLGDPFDWSPAAAKVAMPFLIGHLLYGAAIAVTFWALERRQQQRVRIDARGEPIRSFDYQTVNGPLPALGLFVLGIGVLLPLALV